MSESIWPSNDHVRQVNGSKLVSMCEGAQIFLHSSFLGSRGFIDLCVKVHRQLWRVGVSLVMSGLWYTSKYACPHKLFPREHVWRTQWMRIPTCEVKLPPSDYHSCRAIQSRTYDLLTRNDSPVQVTAKKSLQYSVVWRNVSGPWKDRWLQKYTYHALTVLWLKFCKRQQTKHFSSSAYEPPGSARTRECLQSFRTTLSDQEKDISFTRTRYHHILWKVADARVCSFSRSWRSDAQCASISLPKNKTD